MHSDRDSKNTDENPKLGQIIGSVLSAAIGIQSSKNRERDFKHGKTSTFVIAGIIFVALFITTVFTVVKLVLKQNGY